jgi:hypothetical protein
MVWSRNACYKGRAHGVLLVRWGTFGTTSQWCSSISEQSSMVMLRHGVEIENSDYIIWRPL